MTKKNINIDIGIDINNSRYSVTENIYYILKNNIINWNLKPGQRISEKEMSDILNVSRTPVRESFITLSKEGLLEILPQRGTFISRVDLGEVEEGMFIRKNLEIPVIQQAIHEFPKKYINTLEDLLDKQAESISEDNCKEFIKYDEKFHRIIFKGCNKEKTWEVIQAANTQYNRVRMLTLIDINKSEILVQEHKDILSAIKNKDMLLGEKMIKEHLEKLYVEKKILKSKYPEYFL